MTSKPGVEAPTQVHAWDSPSLRDAYVLDTQDCGPGRWFASSADTLQILNGVPLFASPYSGEPSERETQVIPAYKQEDTRPAKVIKAERKRYKKAHNYYGKTHTFTDTQVKLAMVVVIGAVLILSSLMFTVYVKFAEAIGVM
jgi:hypothetical protein